MPPPPKKQQEARRGQLVHGLLWAGVGLAPLAVLVLLFGSSAGALRVAVILTTLTVVMIAVSIALRPSVELLRVDIEEKVLDEVDHIRVRAREDVSTAARNTHRALTGQIREIGEAMEDLRNQLIELQAQQMIVGQHELSAGPGPGGPGMVRRTETVHVTRRTTMVGGDEADTGTVYGSRTAPVEGEWRERGDERWAAARQDDGDRRDERRRDGGYGEADWEATFRSLSSKSPPALPAGRDSRDEFENGDWTRLGGRGDDRPREQDRPRDYDRGRDREYDRGRDDRPRDYDRDRDRGRDYDRGRDDRPRDYDRERDRDYDRGRDDRGRDDRGRDDRPRDYDRERDDRRYDDRRPDDRGYPPRQRGPHHSEYDR